MAADAEDAPPPDGGWTPLDPDPFTSLTGPLYHSARGLGADEPFRLGFRVAPRHCNRGQVCHGGMMATYLDMALGLAMRAATGAIDPSPTMNMTIDFVSAAALGDWVESRARVVQAGYRTAFCDVIALGPKGPVARANAIFRVTRPEQSARS